MSKKEIKVRSYSFPKMPERPDTRKPSETERTQDLLKTLELETPIELLRTPDTEKVLEPRRIPENEAPQVGLGILEKERVPEPQRRLDLEIQPPRIIFEEVERITESRPTETDISQELRRTPAEPQPFETQETQRSYGNSEINDGLKKNQNYRINLKLRAEYREYLELEAWRARKSITEFINDLIEEHRQKNN